jgi:hypothetical protein
MKHPADGGTSINTAVLAWNADGYFKSGKIQNYRVDPLTGEKNE